MTGRAHLNDNLLNSLYLAPTAPDAWVPALGAIATPFRSIWSALIVLDLACTPGEIPPPRAPQFQIGFGIPEDAVRLYSSYYAAKDPWYLALRKRQTFTWIGPGTALCPARNFEKTEFYNDFFKAGRYPAYYQLGATVPIGEGRHAVLTVLREKKEGDYSPVEIRCLREMAPHLRRALEIEARVSGLKETARGTARLLASLDTALIAVDGDGRCHYANPLAESMLRSAKFLRISGDGLAAFDPNESAALRNLIRKAAARIWSGSPLGGYLTLHSEGRCLHISVIPLATPLLNLPTQARVLVTACSPETVPGRRDTPLSALFRMTASEARVAMLLVEGLGAKEIADRTHTTYDTARFQLKTIYQKTGVSRQSQLVRLISQIPAADNAAPA